MPCNQRNSGHKPVCKRLSPSGGIKGAAVSAEWRATANGAEAAQRSSKRTHTITIAITIAIAIAIAITIIAVNHSTSNAVINRQLHPHILHTLFLFPTPRFTLLLLHCVAHVPFVLCPATAERIGRV